MHALTIVTTLHIYIGATFILIYIFRYYLLAEKDLKGSHIKGIRLVLMNKTIPGKLYYIILHI